MALTTRAEAAAQYDANAGYLADATGAKARLFIEACTVLLRYPERSKGVDGEVEFNLDGVRSERAAAARFLGEIGGQVITSVPSHTPRQFSLERWED